MSKIQSTASGDYKELFSLSFWSLPALIAIFLVLISTVNHLLFHTFAELFAVIIAVLGGVVAWNTYPFSRNNYLMYLGVGYFWVGLLDLTHALALKGMAVIPSIGSDPDPSVQLWIATRYFEAFLLCTAPWFLSHNLRRIQSLLVFGVVTSLILYSIFSGRFPTSFIEGKGLTSFKIYSEYIIVCILAVSIFYLYSQRKYLEHQILYPLIASIVITICAELAFTFYISFYGISNIGGHILKVFSFWLIYKAIIRTTLKDPFLVMSRTATTYDAIPDATIMVDDKGLIREVNEAACQISKLSKQELLGCHSHEIFHTNVISLEECIVCKAIAQNSELRGLEVEIDEVGTWYDFTLSTVKGIADLKGTVVVIRDISHKKVAEFKVNELSNLKYSIVENLPSMVFVKDLSTRQIVEWNKASEDITGVSKADILGKTDFDLWPKEQAQQFIDKDDEVVQQKKIIDIPNESLTTEANGTRILNTKKIPIFDQNGKAKYLLGISNDITEKIETEKMLNQAQKMEAVGQLTGGIAHDFNNILGIIIGNLELLEMTIADNEKAQGRIKEAIKGALRGADITRRLLSFSRSKPQDVKQIYVSNVISGMSELIAKSLTVSIEIQTHFADDLWSIEVDPGDLEDAILNLSLNAKDAIQEGGSLIFEASNKILDESYVRCNPGSKSGDFVMISVTDNGKGMSEEVKEKVLEPFFTTKEQGKGTGLGLSMVYGFVKSSGGHIKIYSELGKGTTFHLFFPRIQGVEQCGIQDENITTDLPRGTETILVVEDEEALKDVATEYLSQLGYKVLIASSAKQALRIIEDHCNIDLVFSDIIMPGGMDGYQLADFVHKEHPEFIMLLTSGFTKNREKLMGHDNEYLQQLEVNRLHKPYNQSELAIAIRSVLNESS